MRQPCRREGQQYALKLNRLRVLSSTTELDCLTHLHNVLALLAPLLPQRRGLKYVVSL